MSQDNIVEFYLRLRNLLTCIIGSKGKNLERVENKNENRMEKEKKEDSISRRNVKKKK